MARRAWCLGVTVVTLALLTFGCAAHKPVTRQPQAEAKLDESFDPSSLGVEKFPVEAPKVIPGQKSPATGSTELAEDTLKAPESQLVLGYRVQICATPDEQEARSYLHEALLKFPDQGVYLTFDSPYYKVRVGDCKSRFEAEELQKRVQKNGFPDAWVVRTKVYANPEAVKKAQSQAQTQPE